MTEERWEQIKETTKKNFEVLENTITDLPEDQGGGTKEALIFNGPLGKIKLEFVIKPLVIGKKTHYSKRMGTSAKVDYIISETEKVNTFFAFKWDEASENWLEIDSAAFQ